MVAAWQLWVASKMLLTRLTLTLDSGMSVERNTYSVCLARHPMKNPKRQRLVSESEFKMKGTLSGQSHVLQSEKSNGAKT